MMIQKIENVLYDRYNVKTVDDDGLKVELHRL